MTTLTRSNRLADAVAETAAKRQGNGSDRLGSRPGAIPLAA